MAFLERRRATRQIRTILIDADEQLELPAVRSLADALDVLLTDTCCWCRTVLGLPMEQLVAQCIVVVRDGLVESTALIERHKHQFGFSIWQAKDASVKEWSMLRG